MLAKFYNSFPPAFNKNKNVKKICYVQLSTLEHPKKNMIMFA